MLDAPCYNRNITVKAYQHLTDNASSTLSKDFLEVKMLITIFSLPMNEILLKILDFLNIIISSHDLIESVLID